MKFYRVEFKCDHGSSAGFAWFMSKQNADKVAKKYDEENPDEEPSIIEKIDITLTRAGLLRFLRLYASHPDNG